MSEPGQPSAGAEQRLESMRQELSRQQAQSQRATLLTAAVGAVSLVLLGGYFYYAYAQLAEFTEPKQMVDVAEGLLEDSLPNGPGEGDRQVLADLGREAEPASPREP